MSRYQVTVKKAGFGAYPCIVTDTENVKPVMQCELQNYNAGGWQGSTPAQYQWRICTPKIYPTDLEGGQGVDFCGGDCCGFQTKREALESLREDGLYWDGKDIHPLLRIK